MDLTAILSKTKVCTIEKMHDKGLIGKRRLAGIVGCTIEQINEVIRKGKIVPARTKRRKNGKSTEFFFSHDQIEQFKEVLAEEARQLMMFEKGQVGRRAAA